MLLLCIQMAYFLNLLFTANLDNKNFPAFHDSGLGTLLFRPTVYTLACSMCTVHCTEAVHVAKHMKPKPWALLYRITEHSGSI